MYDDLKGETFAWTQGSLRIKGRNKTHNYHK